MTVVYPLAPVRVSYGNGVVNHTRCNYRGKVGRYLSPILVVIAFSVYYWRTTGVS